MSSSDFQQISEANLNKISNAVTKIGYVDGITAGKDSTFQTGFDQGYADGLRTALEISKWRSLMTSIAHQNTTEINDILLPPKDKYHFQMNKNPEKSVTEISEIQNRYVNDVVERLKQEFPKISDKLYFKE